LLPRNHRVVLVAVTTATAIILPVQVVIGSLTHVAFTWFSWGVTLFFALDLLLRLRAARARGAPHDRTPRARAWLAMDAVAALPLHLVPVPPLQLLRLVKLARLGQMMEERKRRSGEHWTAVRLGFFVYWLALTVHWLACGWFALHAGDAGERADYLTALYWCVQTLTTVGYGDIAVVTPAEHIYAMVVMILGVGVYGYVIGNVASLLQKADPARAHHQENMQRLEVFMRQRSLPAPLQERIRDYNTYLWERRLGYDEETILSGLPHGLLREVMLHLKREVIEKVPMFRGAPEELISDLALELRPLVFTPGEVLFRAGEAGQEMYFISRGAIEILGKDGGYLATLHEGDFFGEIALFTHQPRTASARASGYCDLYALDTASFDRVLARHPSFARHIEAMSRERQGRGG
jgi:voltage-gated potassium channel